MSCPFCRIKYRKEKKKAEGGKNSKRERTTQVGESEGKKKHTLRLQKEPGRER